MGSSGSNGIVEKAAQEIEGDQRAAWLAFEASIGREIDARERVVAFIPDYVAYLRNRLKRGEDGKVAYERTRGKQPTVIGVEFGYGTVGVAIMCRLFGY